MEQPNIEYIIKLSGNVETIKQKFINVIKYELPLEIDAYFVCLHMGRFKQASECIHKLKHKMAVLGLEQGYYTAEEYEKEIQAGEMKTQDKFENTLHLMQDFVNSL